MKRQPEPELMDLDAEAEAYATADFAEVNAAFAERLLEVAGTRQTVLAVDLGTGPGDIPLRVARARPDWCIVGIDGSFAMLGHARRATPYGASINWLQANAKRLPFRSRVFDVVFSNSILHHITDIAPFWTELKRIAKPGAAVFLRDLARPPSTETARGIVSEYAGDESPLLQEEFYRSLLSAYTVDEVRVQLARTDLDSLEVVVSSDRHLDVFGKNGPG